MQYRLIYWRACNTASCHIPLSRNLLCMACPLSVPCSLLTMTGLPLPLTLPGQFCSTPAFLFCCQRARLLPLFWVSSRLRLQAGRSPPLQVRTLRRAGHVYCLAASMCCCQLSQMGIHCMNVNYKLYQQLVHYFLRQCLVILCHGCTVVWAFLA